MTGGYPPLSGADLYFAPWTVHTEAVTYKAVAEVLNDDDEMINVEVEFKAMDNTSDEDLHQRAVEAVFEAYPDVYIEEIDINKLY